MSIVENSTGEYNSVLHLHRKRSTKFGLRLDWVGGQGGRRAKATWFLQQPSLGEDSHAYDYDSLEINGRAIFLPVYHVHGTRGK